MIPEVELQCAALVTYQTSQLFKHLSPSMLDLYGDFLSLAASSHYTAICHGMYPFAAPSSVVPLPLACATVCKSHGIPVLSLGSETQ